MTNTHNNPFTEGNMAEAFTNLSIDNNNIFRATSNRGFVIAPQKILRCFRLSEVEKILLLDIASMTGDRGYAFYSHNYMAFRLGKKSTASIKKNLKGLKSKRFIAWQVGGGDYGTNHYRLSNLYNNPYLILSEAVHYFADQVLKSFRNQISYDILYGSILQFVEQPKDTQNSSWDIYGKFISHLAKNPLERDSLELYMNLFARLFKSLWTNRRVYISPEWQKSFQDSFTEKFYKVVRSEPKFTLSLSDFNVGDYKKFNFPVEVNLYQLTEDESKSPERKAFERNMISEVEEYVNSLTHEKVILECRQRGIPTTYDEAVAMHKSNGGA